MRVRSTRALIIGERNYEWKQSGNKPTWVKQGSDEIVIAAEPRVIFSILDNSQLLPKWMPAVKSTNGAQESLGALRHCSVCFDGRDGCVVEECVKYDPPHAIGWRLKEDTLGFSGMLKYFTFDFVLQPVGPSSTRVVHSSYFEPQNLIAKLIAAPVLRPNFRSIRQHVL